jgi:hypothetical protein
MWNLLKTSDSKAFQDSDFGRRRKPKTMDESPRFPVLEFTNLETQTICEECGLDAAVLRYELIPGVARGRCCLACFTNLLRTMAAGAGEADRKLKL